MHDELAANSVLSLAPTAVHALFLRSNIGMLMLPSTVEAKEHRLCLALLLRN